MSAGKRIVTAVIVAAVAAGAGFGGWKLWKKYGDELTAGSEKVYVQKVSAVNTVNTGDIFSNSFSGVIVAQKSVDVKYDTTKTVKELLVENGSTVKKGDKVLNYDVEAIKLEIETAKLEVERLETGIKANEEEIKQLEEEKKKASADLAVGYTTQILSLQSDNARDEYDIKAKKVEIQKLEASLDNAYITAPIDGVVSGIKDNWASSSGEYDYGENADVIMKITADGNYRVKGVFNEQNAGQIYQGAPVILKSRVDDTSWKGTVSEIDMNPQQDNNNDYYYGGEDDEQTTASKYAFYVEPESLDGFMLGQHLLIELDNGSSDTQKTGIWLVSDFVLKDGDKSYVWAKDESRDVIEKRYVELGQTDEAAGDVEIISGLSGSDYIAYPAKYIKSGLKTTMNQSEVSVPDNDLGGDEDGGEDFEDGGEDVEDGGEGIDTFTDDNGYTYTFSSDGQMTITDPDGKVYTSDEETGNMIGEDGVSYIFNENGELVEGSYEDMDFGEDDEAQQSFEELYGISESELMSMTDEEREAFFKEYYENN